MLKDVDLSLSLDLETYNRLLKRYQRELNKLGYQIYTQKKPVVIIFEGCQLRGTAGIIRSITNALDPRAFIIHTISPPVGEEAKRHYMWRYWQRLPPAGRIAIFNHSWYSRVIDERLGGRCPDETCRRAYREINIFEDQLLNFGTAIFKFWLHSDQRQPASLPDGSHNAVSLLTQKHGVGWCSHDNWDLYKEAANEMLLKTSTTKAPWTIIESNSELYAQIKTLKTLVVGLKLAFAEPSGKSSKNFGSDKKKKRKGNKK